MKKLIPPTYVVTFLVFLAFIGTLVFHTHEPPHDPVWKVVVAVVVAIILTAMARALKNIGGPFS